MNREQAIDASVMKAMPALKLIYSRGDAPNRITVELIFADKIRRIFKLLVS